MEHAYICPQCNAPLAPSRFARSVLCSYCGTTVQLDDHLSVSSRTFREAFRVWNSPQSYQVPAWVSLGESHWALGQCIANGEIADVYTGQRARWPTELVVLKFLRDHRNSKILDNEWEALQMLHRSSAPGADTFTMLLPQPVLHGNISAGQYEGTHMSIFRWESGFYNSLEAVIRVYPQGIPPRASIWLWRRILETLSFIHASGMVHGAVLPSHILIQENEHGARLVGYGCAGRAGEKLLTVPGGSESYYPRSAQTRITLTAQLDLVMSARCMLAVLGGNPADASLPSTVPMPLASIVQRIALTDPNGTKAEDAWTIRAELGKIADIVFGPPQFIPITMSS
jgi:serine/threonine protein kinase